MFSDVTTTQEKYRARAYEAYCRNCQAQGITPLSSESLNKKVADLVLTEDEK